MATDGGDWQALARDSATDLAWSKGKRALAGTGNGTGTPKGHRIQCTGVAAKSRARSGTDTGAETGNGNGRSWLWHWHPNPAWHGKQALVKVVALAPGNGHMQGSCYSHWHLCDYVGTSTSKGNSTGTHLGSGTDTPRKSWYDTVTSSRESGRPRRI